MKKAQFVGLIFMLIVFLIVFAIALSYMVGIAGVMLSSQTTGIEQFFANNLRGVILLSLFIGVIWLSYMGLRG